MLTQVNMIVGHGRDEREIWFLFETEHADLFEFNEAMAEDGSVYGQRIESENADKGQRREVGRQEFILGRGSFQTVQPARYELLPPIQAAQE